MSTPNLWEFCENGDHHVACLYFRRKGLSPAGNFREKNFTAIISEKVQEVVGGGENPFPTHDIFLNNFFIFSFSRHYEALHRQARNIFNFTQHCPIIAMQLASYNRDHLLILHPSPSLPHDSGSRRVWRSSLLTRIDSVSVFSVLAILDHWPKLWIGISPITERGFCSNFQASWGNPILTS